MNAIELIKPSFILTIAACLLLPPLIAGLVEGVARQLDAKKAGREVPALLQPFRDFISPFRDESATGTPEGAVCLSLATTFFVTSLAMVSLKMDLPPVSFVHGCGTLVLIMVGISRSTTVLGASLNHSLKIFMSTQFVMFMAVIGVYFATGTFRLGTAQSHPRMLALDLPVIFLALLLVDHALNKEAFKGVVTSGPLRSAAILSECYRSSALLLLAGSFFSQNLNSAIIAAMLLHILLFCFRRLSWSESLRVKEADGLWGYVFVACAFNLAWVYMKYWI